MDDEQRHPPRSGPPRGDRPASQPRAGNNSGGLLSRYRAGESNGDVDAGGPPNAAPSPPPQAPPSPAPARAAPASRQPANPPRRGPGASWHRYDPTSGQWVDPATPDPSAAEEPPAPVSASPADEAPSAQGDVPRRGGLLKRFAQVEEAAGRAWGTLTSQGRAALDGVRGAAGGTRQPSGGDWRASDYDPEELDRLIESEEVAARRVVSYDAAPASRSYREPAGRAQGAARRPQDQPPAGSRRGTYWDDEEEWERDWEAGWETGTWDTGWATDWRDASSEYGYDDYDGYGYDADGGWEQQDDYADDAWSRSLVALGAASMAEVPMGRIARIRMVVRERPAAGAMLIVFLLGFVLTCVAPLIPLMRLGYDVADAARRASHLQQLVKADPTQLIRPDQLAAVQADVNALEHDLYEINAVTNVLGAPLASASHKLADYRLLVRMGFDLTAAADEGLQVGRILLVPLQGGALVASDSSPGITADDIHQARGLLADARTRVQDAVSAYQQLDQAALPSQLRPGSRYGSLLELLPTSAGVFDELDTLLSIAPGLLGVGQPAHYLVLAMDRTELRPGGGFQGNYGILTLVGGKQPANEPLSLQDAYALDRNFYKYTLSQGDKSVSDFLANQCTLQTEGKIGGPPPEDFGPEQPRYYWWWPYQDFSWCFNWGVRDSNLSPDFPTNARDAMAIAQETPGTLPDSAPLQGAVAFTPQLIGALLNVPGVGPITLPQYPKDPPITAANLEQQIHCHQLPFGPCPNSSNAGGADRKQFTHLLSQAVLAKVKQLHGSALKQVVQVALNALKTKDLQVYFADPRAELILQQLGLSSQIQTGNGDGFFVVDTNDGANKANQYVSEHQEDLVTLLPNGGAVHRLKITVTYAYPKGGWVYADVNTPEDYNDVQRVYMPGDATILGYNGYALPQNQTPFEPQPLNDCPPGNDVHCLFSPITNSDVPGRTMVMGFVDVSCHNDLYSGQPMYLIHWQEPGRGDGQSCNINPNTNHQTIYVEWYSPNAWTPSGSGHGSYSELVEKQAGTDGPPSATNPSGSVVSVAVYVDTSLLHGNPQPTDWTDTGLRAAALSHATKVYDQPLASDTTVTFNF